MQKLKILKALIGACMQAITEKALRLTVNICGTFEEVYRGNAGRNMDRYKQTRIKESQV